MNNSPLPRQFALDISHTPTPSLSNFLAGENLALHSTLQDLVKSWESNHPRLASENPLNQRWIYWWGPKGSGRTHLLSAIGMAAQELGLEYFPLTPNEPISWVGLEERLPSLSTSNQPSVITLDDVDRLDERLVASLFRILNEIQGSKAIHIFMAGNAAPGALKLREDLRTRLGWGHVFHLQLLDDDQRREVLLRHAQALGMTLNHDVLDYLLSRFSRDLGHLMDLLQRLDTYALQTQRPLTIPLLRAMLDEL